MHEVRPGEIINAWTAQVLGDPKTARQLGAVYKFIVKGAHGGSWIFDCASTPKVEQGEGKAQCCISMSAEDFAAVAQGFLNPQSAFWQGRIRLCGDITLALRLHALCGRLPLKNEA